MRCHCEIGHLCWKSDRVYYLFTLELPVSTKEKAVISHLINAPLWTTPSDCSRSLSVFLCIWTKQRFGRWTVCLLGSGSVLVSAGRGYGHLQQQLQGWIRVDSGLPWSHPVSFPYLSSALALWSPVALYTGVLQTIPELLCHRFVFFFFFTHKVAVQFKGTSVQGNNRTGDMQCCFSEIVLAGLLLDNLIR